MSSNNEPVKILAPESFRAKLSRRTLFQVGGAAAGLAILAACGDDDNAASDATSGGGTTAPGATSGGGTVAAGSGDVGDSGTGLGVATGDWSRVVNKSSGTLNMYTWGAYNDPDIVGALAEQQLGIKMQVSYYTSNEDLITKLEASKGTSGFDVVVPTGPYVPQMIENGPVREVRQVEAAQHGQRRPDLHGAGLGPHQRLQRLQGLGLDRLVLRQDEDQDRDQDVAGLHGRVHGTRAARTARCSTRRQPRRHVLLGQRHRLEHRGDGRPRRLREVHRRRLRFSHQGLRQLSVRPRSPRARTQSR